MKHSHNIIVNDDGNLFHVFRIKELENGDLNYNFLPLDGKDRVILHSEKIDKVGKEGTVRYSFAGAELINKEIDHFSYHPSSHHLITSPKNKEKKYFNISTFHFTLLLFRKQIYGSIAYSFINLPLMY